jgi:geranyl-CoA carboxylase alpha subunit
VARTARRLGIKTIAVASNVDRDAPHTRACDEAMAIGGERPADSYLHIGKLIDAAQHAGAEAVHPGYGFLSENADFARAVIDAGLVWIGPPPDAMRAMADKAQARRRMQAAGVPVLPGHDGDDQRPETLRDAALRIGLPVMIKATAGGGGRGLRRVQAANELDAALASAAAEALAAFGDARLLIERALMAPRHVEIQVFADTHGNVIHLGERDCSVQRRHQKLIEEAPSPAVDAALRRRMGDAATRIAREVGYVGAGTVEFLLDERGEFWFMEMNTRLQVEHPVTEALVNVDLVEWQLRVAAGEVLPLTQQEALARYERGGHAIEARLCAEDAAAGHLPQAGRLLSWQPPDGARCDHALANDIDISPYYDSMLAKLIVHAPSREAAAHRLAEALDRTVCLGLTTNRGFLSRVLRHPAFTTDSVSTAFLDQHFSGDSARSTPPASWLRALAAAAHATLPSAALPPLWTAWTSSNHVDTVAPIAVDESVESWRLSGTPVALTARCADHEHSIDGLVRSGPKTIKAIVDGRPLTAHFARAGNAWWWLCEGIELQTQDLRLTGAPSEATATAGTLLAPMHGRITQVLVETGASIQAGTLLLVMEAMKMEHQIRAPFGGTVAVLHARPGDQVAARQVLIEVQTPGS